MKTTLFQVLYTKYLKEKTHWEKTENSLQIQYDLSHDLAKKCKQLNIQFPPLVQDLEMHQEHRDHCNDALSHITRNTLYALSATNTTVDTECTEINIEDENSCSSTHKGCSPSTKTIRGRNTISSSDTKKNMNSDQGLCRTSTTTNLDNCRTSSVSNSNDLQIDA